ncbi:hypothetical protein QEZ54_35585 [Catellatospora sp. KI3]|uniref:hypothetical protein n=1 Tax=Catellatospora sp. KI3 TaxID=3041620 RepID=UPI0024825844|nr:hypothetical protein [Catellatospora sp. KI3]MDI1466314.1 hypothetical protein [Catellatospora sp. KI3]
MTQISADDDSPDREGVKRDGLVAVARTGDLGQVVLSGEMTAKIAVGGHGVGGNPRFRPELVIMDEARRWRGVSAALPSVGVRGLAGAAGGAGCSAGRNGR